MSSLRSLVHPRKEMLESTLDESIFAANLGTVLKGTALSFYGEPAEFFSRTHPTSGLKALLNLCLGCLAGAQPIIRIDTNLGGGKTHNLIVVDEIAHYLQKADGVEVGNGTLADQTLTLLMALCEAAVRAPRTVLVLTTTQASSVFSSGTKKIVALMTRVREITGWQAHLIQPSAEEGLPSILYGCCLGGWQDW